MSHHVTPQIIKDRARKLRKRQTPTEKILRDYLKNKKLDTIKRYRQHPLCIWVDGLYRRYIADFRSHTLQLVIEIDGGYHNTEKQQEYDATREEMIAWLWIDIVRFTNEQIENNIEEVVQTIRNYKKYSK